MHCQWGFYLVSTSFPGNTNTFAPPRFPVGGGSASLPVKSGLDPLPRPEVLLSALNATTPAATGNLAVPPVTLPGVPEIPPPFMVAPWLFMPKNQPALPANPLPVLPQPVAQPTQPAYTQRTYQPPMAPPVTNATAPKPAVSPVPAASQPAPTQPAKPVPAQPVQPPKPQPPENTEKPPAPKPNALLDNGGLTDETIKKLDEGLNNPSVDARLSTVTDLHKILEKSPGLAKNPDYKPYIDALMEKAIQDPSAAVRGMAEIIMQVGEYKIPTEAITSQLRTLTSKGAQTDDTGEKSSASEILRTVSAEPAEDEKNANKENEIPKKGYAAVPAGVKYKPGASNPNPQNALQPSTAAQNSKTPPEKKLPEEAAKTEASKKEGLMSTARNWLAKKIAPPTTPPQPVAGGATRQKLPAPTGIKPEQPLASAEKPSAAQTIPASGSATNSTATPTSPASGSAMPPLEDPASNDSATATPQPPQEGG
jgi:hypothetical protein